MTFAPSFMLKLKGTRWTRQVGIAGNLIDAAGRLNPSLVVLFGHEREFGSTLILSARRNSVNGRRLTFVREA